MATSSLANLPLRELLEAHLQEPLAGAARELFAEFVGSRAMLLTIFYVVSQPIIKAILGSKGESYKTHRTFWKTTMFVYNALMSLFSAVVFAITVWTMYKRNFVVKTEQCHELDADKLYNQALYAFYISKFVEYVDTFFIIVRGAPVTYLQWYHHIGAAISCWFSVYHPGEPFWIFMGLNSGIHTIMYAYFAGMTMGVSILPKMFITSMQIGQFLYGFTILYGYKDVSCFVDDSKSFLGLWTYNYIYVGTVLMLFLNFFVVNYLIGGKKRADAKLGEAKKAA